MSLIQVSVLSDEGGTLVIPLDDTGAGYFIEDIEGLNPVQSEFSSSPFGLIDGEQFQSARRGNRNIVMTVGFDPDYGVDTVRTLRRVLYKFLMPKRNVRLRFTTEDSNVVEIEGKVESFESPLFTREPNATISIICFKPDFYDLDLLVANGVTTSGTTKTEIEYDGDVSTGLIFKLLPNRSVGDFKLIHHGTDNVSKVLDFAYPLLNGDSLEINTNAREKGAFLNRGSVRSSILYGVSPQSDWMQLVPGTNYIRVLTSGAAIPWTITYRTKFGGL